ncbi:MAG: hypothetical protein J0H52_17680, partial [Comamonadaceae bacterium]|nr:hypothetical protein [Comamonadaceae bacterium]
ITLLLKTVATKAGEEFPLTSAWVRADSMPPCFCKILLHLRVISHKKAVQNGFVEVRGDGFVTRSGAMVGRKG